MNSPINGEPMVKVTTKDTVIFRERKIEYEHKGYMCTKSGLTFTTTKQDTSNMERITDEYDRIVEKENNEAMKSFFIMAVVVIIMILIIIL